MEDDKIILLFQRRDETSISELSMKYGGICRRTAQNILGDFTEVEECLNDTYLKVWESIPPAVPSSLAAFAAAITRNIALMRLRAKHTEKRGGGETALSFDELEDFVSGGHRVEDEMERKELIGAVNDFLRRLPERQRQMFVRRYWGCLGISEIAQRLGMTESNVTVTLTRVRKKLKDYLTKRGYNL